MQTHQLGKQRYQTVEFEFDEKPVYCIIMKELFCGDEEEDLYNKGCEIDQLDHSGNYHIILITNTGTFQDTIFRDVNGQWDSIYEEPDEDFDDEDEDEDVDEDEAPENYFYLVNIIGKKIEASQITF
jgi:hypothetical protein